ncbi:MAG: hypothetical protein OXU75_02280 [Deltaproteobacteria bacterium]|nr:hypothetical protein [Deltaproteobacteria bacterium]
MEPSSDPNILSYLWGLLRDEAVVYGLRYLIAFVIAMLGYLSFGPRYKKRIADLEKEVADLKKGQQGAPSVEISMETEKHEETAEERVFTQRTASELIALQGSMTESEIDRLMEPHIGKWIRVQGVIRNISTVRDSYLVVITLPIDEIISLEFPRDDVSSIGTMTKGDHLAAIGRIAKMRPSRLHLDDCEQVELQETEGS